MASVSTNTPRPNHPGGHGTPSASASGAGVGHVYLDVRSRQLHCLNAQAKKLRDEGIPFTPEDVRSTPLLGLTGEAVGPEDLPLIKAWKKSRTAEAVFLFTRAGGALHRVVWTASPVLDADGKVFGVIGTVACAAPEPDWQALAGLAHDLRTPLQALKLLLTLMADRTPAGDDSEEVLRRIHASADRALDIGLELLEWCRAPVLLGRRQEATWISLEPLLLELAGEQAGAARTKNLELVLDLACTRTLEVHTDRRRLGRLLSNLLSNAIRYTEAGRVEFKAAWSNEPSSPELPGSLSALVPDERPRNLVLSVTDTGVGISPEESESIFQPFERGRAAREGDSGGSGLGLAIVDRLVEELGLTLEVYSEFGRGSAFHLTLPSQVIRS